MSTNVFFNNFESYSEQNLIEDLIIESIKIYGHDLYYCPRTIEKKDDVFGEGVISSYNDAYLIEMYIKNVEGFEGEGAFLSKFNIQIRDEITFTVANRVFADEVGAAEIIERPREGDLIYFPLSEKVYVVKFAEHEAPNFYQLGALQCYDLRCELFEYSHEDLNTGIPQIDDLEELYSRNIAVSNTDSAHANGDVIMDANTGRPVAADSYSVEDPFSENATFQTGGAGIIDFTETDPFSEGNI